ncbi:4Fe-4S binding protein [Neisseriaceae bacterium B1]
MSATLITAFLISLPVYAERLPELIKQVQPSDIFPNATKFGTPEGKPMTAKVFEGDKEVGVVYITTDVVNTRGYSSKPIDTIVALDNQGTIKGAKMLAHNEPIVLVGIPVTKVDNFINGYIGLNPTTNPPKAGSTPSEIVTGATVTVVVIGDSIVRSARIITAEMRKKGGAQATAGAASGATAAAQARPHRLPNMDKKDALSWDELLKENAVQKLHLTVADANRLLEQNNPEAAKHPQPGQPESLFIDLYTAVVSQPSIGISLLGEDGFKALQARLKPNQSAIVIAGEGVYSWKGSGYVRGGIFDRIEVIQNDNGFRFIDAHHTRLLDFVAKGAPHFKEVSLFVTPEDFKFDPAEPWRLQLMIQHELGVQNKAFVTVDLNYQMPQAFTVDDPKGEPVLLDAAPVQAAVASDVTPVVDLATGMEAEDANPQRDLWKQMWRDKMPHIIAIGFMLLILTAVFFFQDTLVKYETFYNRFRYVYLTITLGYVGWYLHAQLSVVNVLTFTSSLIHGFSWDYFLMDPFIFTLWCATAMSMIFWGRGAFCGWLCPFGSLQELSNVIAKKLGVKQIVVPFGVHTRLSSIKYLIFMVLFGVSLYDLGFAEKMAEVEPFKTAIILHFIREWWFVLFAVALLVAGLFIERFFCRYLCPLGAAMAIPAKLQIFNWLRRYPMCGNPCQVCNHECPVQAIAPEGDINPNECIQCLNCQVLYNHKTKCPQVVATNKKKAKQAAAKAEWDAQRAEQAVQQSHEQVVHFVKREKKGEE